MTDGPFTEAKEIVARMAILQTKSLAEAIAHTKDFLKIAGDGETEIRQVYEANECGPERQASSTR